MPGHDDRPPMYAWENTTAVPPRVEVGPDRNGPPTFIVGPPANDPTAGRMDRIDLAFSEARALIEGIPAKGINPDTGQPYPDYYGHRMQVIPCPAAAREVARRENEARAEQEKAQPKPEPTPGFGPAHDLAAPGVEPTTDLAQFAHLPPPPTEALAPGLPAPPVNWSPENQAAAEAALERAEEAIAELAPELAEEMGLAASDDLILEFQLEEELRAALQAGALPELTPGELDEQYARYQNEVENVELEKKMGIDRYGDDPPGLEPGLGAEPEPPAPTKGPTGAEAMPEAEPENRPLPERKAAPELGLEAGTEPGKGQEQRIDPAIVKKEMDAPAPDLNHYPKTKEEPTIRVEVTPGGKTVELTASEYAGIHAYRLGLQGGSSPEKQKEKEPSLREKSEAWERGPKNTPHPAARAAMESFPHSIQDSINATPRPRGRGAPRPGRAPSPGVAPSPARSERNRRLGR